MNRGMTVAGVFAVAVSSADACDGMDRHEAQATAVQRTGTSDEASATDSDRHEEGRVRAVRHGIPG